MLYIDPNKVDENANQITSLGAKMQTAMNEVHAKVKSLSADWQDTVQVDYDAEFTKLANSFVSFAETLPSYAQEAHAHADQMRRIGNG